MLFFKKCKKKKNKTQDWDFAAAQAIFTGSNRITRFFGVIFLCDTPNCSKIVALSSVSACLD